MPTASHTYVFLADQEGLVDVGDSAAITFSLDTAGNPAKSLEPNAVGAASPDSERARLAVFTETWEDRYGVPPGGSVTSVQLAGWDYKTYSWSLVTTLRFRFRIVDSTGARVHPVGDLEDFAQAPPALNGSYVHRGAGVERAVDVAFRASNTLVSLEVEASLVGGGSNSFDTDIDNAMVVVTYDPPPAADSIYKPDWDQYPKDKVQKR